MTARRGFLALVGGAVFNGTIMRAAGAGPAPTLILPPATSLPGARLLLGAQQSQMHAFLEIGQHVPKGMFLDWLENGLQLANRYRRPAADLAREEERIELAVAKHGQPHCGDAGGCSVSGSAEVAQIEPPSHPSARSIRRALDVLERIPVEALADLTERLVERLDALDGDPDLEPEEDACEAGECGGLAMRGDGRPGDAADAEPDDDEGDAGVEPCFPESLRTARDGLAEVRRQIVTVSLMRDGRPPRVQRMRCIPWEAAR